VKIQKKIVAKYGKRRKNRINQLLHHVPKTVVEKAKKNKAAMAFEDIRHIRRMYQRGNGQGKNYRSKLNGWSFAEIKLLITYKAAWEGVPVILLSAKQTRGTSQLCPRCGKKITQVYKRQLHCAECKRWMDRGVVAAMNL
jgi:putative transposase